MIEVLVETFDFGMEEEEEFFEIVWALIMRRVVEDDRVVDSK
mgnify:CR=1 FL=1